MLCLEHAPKWELATLEMATGVQGGSAIRFVYCQQMQGQGQHVPNQAVSAQLEATPVPLSLRDRRHQSQHLWRGAMISKCRRAIENIHRWTLTAFAMRCTTVCPISNQLQNLFESTLLLRSRRCSFFEIACDVQASFDERGSKPAFVDEFAPSDKSAKSKSARSVKGFGEQASSRQLTLAKPQVTALQICGYSTTCINP